MGKLTLIDSHPVVPKADAANVTPFEFCRDIYPGDGSGCDKRSTDVMVIFKQLVDTSLKRKVFDCKKHAN